MIVSVVLCTTSQRILTDIYWVSSHYTRQKCEMVKMLIDHVVHISDHLTEEPKCLLQVSGYVTKDAGTVVENSWLVGCYTGVSGNGCSSGSFLVVCQRVDEPASCWKHCNSS